MPYWQSMINANFPRFDDQLILGFSKSRNIAWLELTGTEYLINGNEGPKVAKVFIGAVKSGTNWKPISPPETQVSDAVRRPFAGGFSDSAKIISFQQTIIKDWAGFQSANASQFAKGKTFGKSLTSPSFVAKALKTGFDAISDPKSAYFGWKLSDWSIKDLEGYLGKRHQVKPDEYVFGFNVYAPNPAYEQAGYIKDQPTKSDTRQLDYIHSAKEQGHSRKFAYEDELKNLPKEFERVIAYGFRGDTRPPTEVKKCGGFLPNYARPGHIEGHEKKKNPKMKEYNLPAYQEEETGALNLEKFIKDQFFRGFLSATKSIAIGKCFATGYTNPAHKSDGWLYACYLEGGLHLPPYGKHSWIQYAEQEISMPGILDWQDIVACRRVKQSGAFTGPVYMDPNLSKDNKAAVEIWDLLSGKSQK